MSVPIRRAASDTSGATSIEYALIASLVSIAIVGSAGAVGQALIEVWPAIIAAFT